MGSDVKPRSGLIARCCHGVSFGFGFAVTVFAFSAMFWITWFYFGLSVVQISNSQRRAIVDYSYTTTKTAFTTATPSLNGTTALPTDETSINSISKSSTATSALRGSSRGEFPGKFYKRKDASIEKSLAKGDFSARNRAPHNSNSTLVPTPGTTLTAPRGPPRRLEDEHDNRGKAAILNVSTERSEEEQIHSRRVSPAGSENKAETKYDDREKSPTSVTDLLRPGISPTKVHNTESKVEYSTSSRSSTEQDRTVRDSARSEPRNYDERSKPISSERDAIQSSRRSDSEPAYREPDFDREYPRRRIVNTERETSRYDDVDDDRDRGSRSRYDRRDRGRDTDDRYSKGDSRVYPDDAIRTSIGSDDRRERYPEARRGDDERYDDRYRDTDERDKHRDRDVEMKRNEGRDFDDRSTSRDDRVRDDDRYRPRDDDRYSYRDGYRISDDERYKSRDDDRYRSRDDDRPKYDSDDRYKTRDDDRYKSRDDDRYVPRDDDRYVSRADDRYRSRDDDRYRSRDDDRYRSRNDDRYRSRDDERYRSRDDERYRSRDDDKYRSRDDDRYLSRDDDKYRKEPENRKESGPRYRDEIDTYRPRIDDGRRIDPSPTRSRDRDDREPETETRRDYTSEDRKFSSRVENNSRKDTIVSDYDVEARDRSKLSERDKIDSSRMTRPLYDEDRYKDDEFRKTTRDDDRRISPTRTKDEVSYSRPKEGIHEARYSDTEMERREKNEKYDPSERIYSSRHQDPKISVSVRESSRRLADDRDEYRTRIPSDRSGDAKFNDRREEVVLDRRSYSSEMDGDYRKTRTDYVQEDRSRRPGDETRRYRDDDRYTRRNPTDEYENKRSRPRDFQDEDRSRRRDRYDDDYRYDDKYDSRDQDRYAEREPQSSRKYDRTPDDDERSRRRNIEPSVVRKDEYDDKIERPRSNSPARSNDERSYSRDEYPESRTAPRRRDDDLSAEASQDSRHRYSDDRRRDETLRQDSKTRNSALGSSTTSVFTREPSDVVVREKRYQNTHNNHETTTDATYTDKHNRNLEPVSINRDMPLRPLTAKDVIEAAIKQSDASDQNSRRVYYPVFDPRVSNLTSPEIIRPSERRGTTITAKKK